MGLEYDYQQRPIKETYSIYERNEIEKSGKLNVWKWKAEKKKGVGRKQT